MTIYLFINNDLQKIISNNIYGEDNILSDEETSDCILEILNVLTGKFLEIYLGKSKTYKLDFPKVLIDFENKNNKIKIVQFDAEGNIFEIGLIL